MQFLLKKTFIAKLPAEYFVMGLVLFFSGRGGGLLLFYVRV